MPKPKPHIAIVGGGIGGLFAANALIAHGLRSRSTSRPRRSARSAPASILTPNSVRHLRARRSRPRGGEMGRAGRPAVALLPPRRRADRAGAGHRLVRLERDLRHAPRRPRRFPRRSSAGRRRPLRPSRHGLRAGAATPPVSLRQRRHRRSRRCRRRRRHPLRASALRLPAVEAGVPRHHLPTAASCRASACRTGRWTAGRCGPARPSTSWSSRCATARWSTTSASCRPTRR